MLLKESLSRLSVFRRLPSLAVLLAVWIPPSAADSLDFKPIPTELLFQDSDYAYLKISPDGQYLAGSSLKVGEASGRKAYTVSLWRYEIATGEVVALVNAPNIYVTYFDWVDDNRLICAFFNNQYRWLAFDADGSDQIEIYPFSREIEDYNRFFKSFDNVDIIDPLVNEDDNILIECDWSDQRWRTGKVPKSLYPAGLYKFNTRTQTYSLVARSPALTNEWILDAKGTPILHYGYSPDMLQEIDTIGWRAFSKKNPEEIREYRVVHHLNASGQWQKLEDLPYPEDGFYPCAPLEDSTGFNFLAYNGGDTRALFRYIFGEGVQMEPVKIDPKSDIFWVRKNPFTGQLSSVYSEYHVPEPHFIDPSQEKLHQKLQPAFPQSSIVIENFDRERKRFVIRVYDSANPGEFYILDLESGNLKPIFRINPWLWEYPMGKLQPIKITARDGQILPGYLTLPPGKTRDSGPMPLIVRVHGGPWKSRDSSSLDLINQFYATRGFAVIQVNFRGSRGFGKAFEEMGKYRHGDWMFTDVIDAVRWGIEEGLTRKGLIGIAGGSYGGYAALRGLAEYPELFEFGISLNGVPDFIQAIDYLQTRNRLHSRQFVIDWLGDPEIPEQRQVLQERSPLYNYTSIDDPLFLYFSMRDTVTPFHLHREFHTRLRKADKPITVFSQRYEGHNPFLDVDNRIQMMENLEAFLLEQRERLGK